MVHLRFIPEPRTFKDVVVQIIDYETEHHVVFEGSFKAAYNWLTQNNYVWIPSTNATWVKRQRLTLPRIFDKLITLKNEVFRWPGLKIQR